MSTPPVASSATIVPEATSSTIRQPTGTIDVESSSDSSASFWVSITVDDEAFEFTSEYSESDQARMDVFGDFAACSGFRSAVATYSLLLARSTGDLRSVSIATDEAINGSGIFAGEIRLKLSDWAEYRMARGMMTIDAGLQSGSFVGFDAMGVRISAVFSCASSGSPRPVPLTHHTADDQLNTVEVVAVLTKGDTEMVVDLAVDAGVTEGPIECSPIAAADGFVVRVEGDATIGSLTELELTAGLHATARIRVGGVVYVVDNVVVEGDPTGTAGAFTGATADGVTVAGAYRCD